MRKRTKVILGLGIVLIALIILFTTGSNVGVGTENGLEDIEEYQAVLMKNAV